MSKGQALYSAKKITLSEPIKFGDEIVKEVNFRKPKAKDLRGLNLEKIGMADIMDVGIRICDQPKPVIDELGMKDTGEFLNVVTDFLSDGLDLGPKPLDI